MRQTLFALSFLTIAVHPNPATAQLWNNSPGPVVYEGSVRGQFTTEVIGHLSTNAYTSWHYVEPQFSGIWSESFDVYLNEAGDVCFGRMGCNWESDFSESFGGTVTNLLGDSVLVPASPWVGQSWMWLDDSLIQYQFSVSSFEAVETGEGALMAWRIQLTVPVFDSFGLCADTLLPFVTTSFWVSPGYGVVKWITPAEEFVLVRAEHVVPNRSRSLGTLKSQFGSR